MLSVILEDTRDPAHNLALDEALARTAGIRPVLRLWHNAPSVVVGRFQKVDAVVNLAACASDGVRVVRRATGGIEVFTDTGTLNVTLVRDASAHGPDLDVIVATAVARLGLPPAGLPDGVVQTAWLRTRHATLAHAAVHVTTVGAYGRCYLASGAERRTLADYGLGVGLDAVRAAILSAVVDVYGIACTRQPGPLEQRCRDHLLATRYTDVTWHLTGSAGARASLGFTLD